MEYTVHARNRTFDLLDAYGRPVGRMNYLSWWQADAMVTTVTGANYHFEVKGFWKRHIAVTRDGIVVATLHYTWRNAMIIRLASGVEMQFGAKGMWQRTYELIVADVVAGVAQAEFRWNKMGFEYKLELTDEMHDRELSTILPFMMIYCLQSMRRRHAAAH